MSDTNVTNKPAKGVSRIKFNSAFAEDKELPVSHAGVMSVKRFDLKFNGGEPGLFQSEGGKYVLAEDCKKMFESRQRAVSCLKDLMKAVRREDPQGSRECMQKASFFLASLEKGRNQ